MTGWGELLKRDGGVVYASVDDYYWGEQREGMTGHRSGRKMDEGNELSMCEGKKHQF